MRFPSVFHPADSKLNWLVSYTLVGKERARWGKGNIKIRQGHFSSLFHFPSVKEAGKVGGCSGEPVETSRQLSWTVLFFIIFFFFFFSFPPSYRSYMKDNFILAGDDKRESER